jgi:hypothetical protein
VVEDFHREVKVQAANEELAIRALFLRAFTNCLERVGG